MKITNKRFFGACGALLVALMLFNVLNPAPSSAAPPRAQTCFETQATARTMVKQRDNGHFTTKHIYLDMIQGYKVCLNRLGPNYIKPTWYRYRYDSPHKIQCKKGFKHGLQAVRFTPTFYGMEGMAVKRMPKITVPCEGQTNSVYGRYGRSAPTLVWANNRKLGTPSIRTSAGIDWRGNVHWGDKDGIGVLAQYLYPRRM